MCFFMPFFKNEAVKLKVHILKVNVNLSSRDTSWSTEAAHQRITVQYEDGDKISDLELKIRQKLGKSDDFKIDSLRVKIDFSLGNSK